MSAAPRRTSTLALALIAFGAALLPLVAASAYYLWREQQLAGEVAELERRLGELDAELAPIGHLDQLRGQMLARKGIVDVLQEPQRGLQAALALTTQLPASATLHALDIDARQIALRIGSADATASAQMLERIGAAGFSDAAASTASDGTVALTARIDPARFKSAAAATAVKP